MKTTLCISELKNLNACDEGFNIFKSAHGSNIVTLSQAFESNGWGDIWWYLSEDWESLSKQQQDDINLLGCKWAQSSLVNFEKEFPKDNRPRLAIEAKEKFIAGEITSEELSAAWSAARSAAESAAESAARSVSWPARSAAWSAWSAAWSAARSAAESAAWSARSERSAWSERSAESAESAAKEIFNNDLMELFKRWESE